MHVTRVETTRVGEGGGLPSYWTYGLPRARFVSGRPWCFSEV